MKKIDIYAVGIIYCSVCADKNATREEIEAEVNRLEPTGINSRWQISKDDNFKDGKKNPCVCENDSERLHYLLNC